MRREIRAPHHFTRPVCYSLAVTRLYFVQVVNGAEYSLRAERQYISSSQQLFHFLYAQDGTLLSAAVWGRIHGCHKPDTHQNPEETYEKLTLHVGGERGS